MKVPVSAILAVQAVSLLLLRACVFLAPRECFQMMMASVSNVQLERCLLHPEVQRARSAHVEVNRILREVHVFNVLPDNFQLTVNGANSARTIRSQHCLAHANATVALRDLRRIAPKLFVNLAIQGIIRLMRGSVRHAPPV